MKKKNTIKIIALIVVVAFGFRYLKKETTLQERAVSPNNKKTAPPLKKQNSTPPTIAKEEATATPPEQSKYRSAMTLIMKKFSNAIRSDFNSPDFISLLEEMKLTPKVSSTNHPRRGELKIIRTENNLPGTRYIHAQFFGSGADELLQHLSFEYKKGEKSFDEIIQEAKENYPLKLDTVYKSSGFISWDIGEDYNLWIKILQPEDMQDDPFNSYDIKQDVGTIRLAVELKIH